MLAFRQMPLFYFILFIYLATTACFHVSEYGLDSANKMGLYAIWKAEHQTQFSFARGESHVALAHVNSY